MPSELGAHATFGASRIVMDTLVSIEATSPDENAAPGRIDRALGWFAEVEARCSRFEPDSELMRLCTRPGEVVATSPLLIACLEFALELARLTGGAFDPAVGGRLQAAGFDRSYRSGDRAHAGATDSNATYRDIHIEPEAGTVRLTRPMVIDLGAVAKGFAMDLAARELAGFASFAIDAGGDILVRGVRPDGEVWSVGIQHPRQADEIIDVIEVAEGAVCTSGDYERASADGGAHIVDARGGEGLALASVTVVAPTAMAADGLSTAAFVLGPDEGMDLLRSQRVEGLIVTRALVRDETPGFARMRR
ncbi:MAG TPA: FAD:protein FMN transferase [Dehalococcoidia bacterium]|jgi:thiamine biosynthesis lipoprotein